MVESMMIDAAVFMTWVLAVVAAYGLLCWRLMAATHEYRVEVAREADRWANDPRVSPDARSSLTALADTAYRFLTPWIVLLALMAAAILPRRESRRAAASDDAEVAAKVTAVKLKLVFALITTSPLACLLAAPALALGLLLRGSVDAFANYAAAAGDRFVPRAGQSHAA